MRSEVTGDAETALETAAVALPSSGNERAAAVDRSDIPARRILLHVLIHQLEVEVQVGDRVPANVRTNEISEGMRRDEAGAEGARGREHRPVLAGPVNPADGTFEIGVEGRRPVVLDQRRNRPGGWRRPRIGQRIEVSVGHIHRLAVSVDLPILTVLRIRQTRVPGGVPGEGAGEDGVVAGGEDPIPTLQIDLHTRIDTPTIFAFACIAGDQDGGPAFRQTRAVVSGILDVDVVEHAGNLGLAPPLLDMQRADDVGPTLATKLCGTGYTRRED